MLLDLHNHTQYSPDSRVDPGRLVAVAQRMGLAGIAITDHNAVGGIRVAEAAARGGFLVIPAIEVSTEAGHVLGYGIRDLVPRDLSVAETAERIVALGGVPVAAHPFRFWSGLGPSAVGQAAFPAYETCNGRTLRRGNVRARALARKRKVGETGGSDSHFLDEVARATTAIDAGALRVDDVLQVLVKGGPRPKGSIAGRLRPSDTSRNAWASGSSAGCEGSSSQVFLNPWDVLLDGVLHLQRIRGRRESQHEQGLPASVDDQVLVRLAVDHDRLERILRLGRHGLRRPHEDREHGSEGVHVHTAREAAREVRPRERDEHRFLDAFVLLDLAKQGLETGRVDHRVRSEPAHMDRPRD